MISFCKTHLYLFEIIERIKYWPLLALNHKSKVASNSQIHLMNQGFVRFYNLKTFQERMMLMAINNKLDWTLEPTFALMPC